MGRAFRCDKCHEILDGNPRATIDASRDGTTFGERVEWELCSQCWTAVREVVSTHQQTT